MPPVSKRCVPFLPLTIAAALLAACGNEAAPQTTFSRQGDGASIILDLYNLFFIAAVGVFVVVEGILIYSVFRYRRRPEDGIPLQVHGNKPIEIAWTILPALLVLFLATATFRTQLLLTKPPEDPIRVTVVGHQWWWEFQYPDYDVRTANEVHIPANRDIEFTLQSVDVIHSFWLPRLSGKTDVIPGHDNKLVFKAHDTAEPILIRGQCAEFCGGTHAQMGMYAVVEPQADFDAWIRQQQTEAARPAGITAATPGAPEATPESEASTGATITAIETVVPGAPAPLAQGAGPEAQGYQLFQSKGCIGCHAIQGYPNATGLVGPDLTHIGSRQHIVAGWLENTPENMRRWLADPNEVKPGNVMGNVIKQGTLSEEEIEALTAYLASLK